MPRVLSLNQWHRSLSGSYDGSIVWLLSVALRMEAYEGKWLLFVYDLHQDTFFYIDGY